MIELTQQDFTDIMKDQGLENITYEQVRKILRIFSEKDEWISVDYNSTPKGEVLLLTTSKTILKGDWYENNLVKGFGWRTEYSQWAFEAADGKEYLTLTPKEEVTHWQPLPKPPK